MIHGRISSKELDPKKGLRAKDYLLDPRDVAKNTINKWLDQFPYLASFLRVRGPVMGRLKELIRDAVDTAYKQGQARSDAEYRTLVQAISEPVRAGELHDELSDSPLWDRLEAEDDDGMR